MTRNAGTSALAMYQVIRRRRRRRVVTALAVLGAAVVAAASHQPLPVTAALAAAGVLCAASLSGGVLRDPDRWRRGAQGEQRTAELLDSLPSRSWAVWHDLRVPGSSANIDHLVVGRTGVWVVDTKYPRGEVRPGWRSVRFGGKRLDTGPVRWEADVVAERLTQLVGESLRKPLVVRPIVAVHGSGLGSRGVRVAGVPVVGADRLTARIGRGRRRASRADSRVLRRVVEENLA